MKLSTYLSFDGRCEAAFKFYEQCLGGKIAPIFFNTMEDAGALPIECDVTKMNMGDVITIHPYEGKITNEAGDVISEFELSTPVLLDEVRAGGRMLHRSRCPKARATSCNPEPFGGAEVPSFGRSSGPAQRAENAVLSACRYRKSAS